jgi:DNA helicase-2/ATP-dependent DNA helicase PcrA
MMENKNMLDELNPRQREAVETTEGPLLVLAGAGTGKTKVLTYRIAHIIKSNLAAPNQILSVTFTNKAASEMQERVRQLINSDGIMLGTFHATAAKILRQHAELYNLTASFSIINPDDQYKIIKEILTEMNVDIKTHPPKLISSIIARWKDAGLTSEKISYGDVKSQSHGVAKNLYPAYQAKLVASNVVDFGDLTLYNIQLFIKYPEILEHYQDKYRYILVDEYQDTNPVQYIWTRMLAAKHNNLCCVGDDDQSIYSWRGAEIGNILRFEKDFQNAKVIKLEQNYRSTTPILNVAGRLIKCNKHRHGKDLWTQGSEGNAVKVVYCWNDREEARFVTTEISSRTSNQLTALKNIAILVRAGFQTRPFEEALISLSIPYKIIGGMKFYERMEIRDAIAYIRASLNHNDNIALERVINTPKRSIGDATIAAIKSFANAHDMSMFDAIKEMILGNLFKPRVHSALSIFTTKLEEWRNIYNVNSLYEATKIILEESGYMEMLKDENSEESRSRIENLREMMRAMNDFDRIEDFLEHSSLVMDGDLSQKTDNAVNLMTVHAAKGLEFDLVFLPGLEEGIFPHQKSISEEGAKGLEEERRLAYVGITRAKKELYISYAESRRMYNEYINSTPSRFIAEIIGDGVQKISSQQNYNKRPVREIKPEQISQFRMKENFFPGFAVAHEIFGKGIVIRTNGKNIEVAFSSHGIKTVKEEYLGICD